MVARHAWLTEEKIVRRDYHIVSHGFKHDGSFKTPLLSCEFCGDIITYKKHCVHVEEVYGKMESTVQDVMREIISLKSELDNKYEEVRPINSNSVFEACAGEMLSRKEGFEFDRNNFQRSVATMFIQPLKFKFVESAEDYSEDQPLTFKDKIRNLDWEGVLGLNCFVLVFIMCGLLAKTLFGLMSEKIDLKGVFGLCGGLVFITGMFVSFKFIPDDVIKYVSGKIEDTFYAIERIVNRARENALVSLSFLAIFSTVVIFLILFGD